MKFREYTESREIAEMNMPELVDYFKEVKHTVIGRDNITISVEGGYLPGDTGQGLIRFRNTNRGAFVYPIPFKDAEKILDNMIAGLQAAKKELSRAVAVKNVESKKVWDRHMKEAEAKKGKTK